MFDTGRRFTQQLAGAALISSAFLAGCASEPPPVPPAELGSFSTQIQVLRIWSSTAGDTGRGLFEPLVVNDQIIVANEDGLLTAFDLTSGLRQWRRELDVTLTSGVGGTSDLAFVSDVNANVHAIDLADGSEKWKVQASSEVLMPVVSDFGVAVLRSADGRVSALEPETGDERWSVSNTPPALTLNGYSRPLLLDGGVLVGLDDGRLLALELATGKLIWETVLSVPSGRTEIERMVDIDADIVIDNEGIYVANYQGRAARLEPGRGQIVWSSPLSVGSGIALDDGGVIIIDEDDRILKLDKATGSELWVNGSMRGRRLSPPALSAEGDIVVGDLEGYLHVLDAANGEMLGRARPSKEPIVARPLLVDDTLYVQAVNGIVAAYRLTR